LSAEFEKESGRTRRVVKIDHKSTIPAQQIFNNRTTRATGVDLMQAMFVPTCVEITPCCDHGGPFTFSQNAGLERSLLKEFVEHIFYGLDGFVIAWRFVLDAGGWQAREFGTEKSHADPAIETGEFIATGARIERDPKERRLWHSEVDPEMIGEIGVGMRLGRGTQQVACGAHKTSVPTGKRTLRFLERM